MELMKHKPNELLKVECTTIFYTTIRNVNYPKNGTNSAKAGSSSNNRGSSKEQNHSLVDIYGNIKRISKEELWKRVLTFCKGWHSSEDIVVLTGKTPKYIKEVVLPQMMKAGVLERLYPETPNHPKQKYRAKVNDCLSQLPNKE